MLIKHNIRRRIAPKRMSLLHSPRPRQVQACNQRLIRLIQSQPCQHIAFYLANPNEMDLSIAIRWCQRLGKTCYVPVLKAKSGHMVLAKLKHATLFPNRYGILEPQATPSALPIAPQIICVPLVAFDTQGHRLGMGKGYYDRLLLQLPNTLKVGISYDFQKINCLPASPHDIPLDGIITDKQTYVIDNDQLK